MTPVTLHQYYFLLEKHDWYYHFSDDINVYRKGMTDRARLLEMSDQTPNHRSLFYGFADHYYTGAPWTTEKKPKPEKPRE